MLDFFSDFRHINAMKFIILNAQSVQLKYFIDSSESLNRDDVAFIRTVFLLDSGLSIRL